MIHKSHGIYQMCHDMTIDQGPLIFPSWCSKRCLRVSTLKCWRQGSHWGGFLNLFESKRITPSLIPVLRTVPSHQIAFIFVLTISFFFKKSTVSLHIEVALPRINWPKIMGTLFQASMWYALSWLLDDKTLPHFNLVEGSMFTAIEV